MYTPEQIRAAGISGEINSIDVEHLINILEESKPIQKGIEWVKASDRLPAFSGLYLVKDRTDKVLWNRSKLISRLNYLKRNNQPINFEWLDESVAALENKVSDISAEKVLQKHTITCPFVIAGKSIHYILGAMEEYASQFKQPDIGEDVENNVSIVRRLEDIMSQFGEAHNMLAKTSLSKDEYQPISSLLATTKIGLFNIYNELKNKITWAHKVESQQPIPTIDEDELWNEILNALGLGFVNREEFISQAKQQFSITRK